MVDPGAQVNWSIFWFLTWFPLRRAYNRNTKGIEERAREFTTSCFLNSWPEYELDVACKGSLRMLNGTNKVVGCGILYKFYTGTERKIVDPELSGYTFIYGINFLPVFAVCEANV